MAFDAFVASSPHSSCPVTLAILAALRTLSPMSTRGQVRGARGRGSSSRGSNTRFTGKKSSFRGNSGQKYGIDSRSDKPGPSREDDGTAMMERFEEVKAYDEVDDKMGFERFESGLASGEERVGWLVNMHPVSSLATTTDRRHCCNLGHQHPANKLLISTSSRITDHHSKPRSLMSHTSF
jgi:hypothetical protein